MTEPPTAPQTAVKKPILCLDFDGVCHSYTSGWKGADVIPDPPVTGLFEFLEKASRIFDIHVFSSRTAQPGGKEAMIAWFIDERKRWREAGGVGRAVLGISFPTEKPPAFVTLDDRALTFNGIWPDVETLAAFTPWNQHQ